MRIKQKDGARQASLVSMQRVLRYMASDRNDGLARGLHYMLDDIEGRMEAVVGHELTIEEDAAQTHMGLSLVAIRAIAYLLQSNPMYGTPELQDQIDNAIAQAFRSVK